MKKVYQVVCSFKNANGEYIGLTVGATGIAGELAAAVFVSREDAEEAATKSLTAMADLMDEPYEVFIEGDEGESDVLHFTESDVFLSVDIMELEVR